MILKRGARRLRSGDREAGEREHRPVAGLDHRDAADLAAQRVLCAALQPEADRGGDRAALAALDAGDHAVAEAQARAAAARRAGRHRALSPVGFLPETPAIEAPVSSEFEQLPARP